MDEDQTVAQAVLFVAVVCHEEQMLFEVVKQEGGIYRCHIDVVMFLVVFPTRKDCVREKGEKNKLLHICFNRQPTAPLFSWGQKSSPITNHLIVCRFCLIFIWFFFLKMWTTLEIT